MAQSTDGCTPARAGFVDELDGLTISSRDWWFNLRPSNTEPLLRLNVEAHDSKTLEAVKSQVLRLVINQ